MIPDSHPSFRLRHPRSSWTEPQLVCTLLTHLLVGSDAQAVAMPRIPHVDDESLRLAAHEHLLVMTEVLIKMLHLLTDVFFFFC